MADLGRQNRSDIQGDYRGIGGSKKYFLRRACEALPPAVMMWLTVTVIRACVHPDALLGRVRDCYSGAAP